MADSKNVAAIQPLMGWEPDSGWAAIAVPTQMGTTATLYMGGLMAASHSLRLDKGIASVEMLLKRIVLHKIGRFHFRTVRYRP